MIDTDKYEEMTWQTPPNDYAIAVKELLAEVKRLREGIEQAIQTAGTTAVGKATKEQLKEMIE